MYQIHQSIKCNCSLKHTTAQELPEEREPEKGTLSSPKSLTTLEPTPSGKWIPAQDPRTELRCQQLLKRPNLQLKPNQVNCLINHQFSEECTRNQSLNIQ